jgi:hypothetical protein
MMAWNIIMELMHVTIVHKVSEHIIFNVKSNNTCKSTNLLNKTFLVLPISRHNYVYGDMHSLYLFLVLPVLCYNCMWTYSLIWQTQWKVWHILQDGWVTKNRNFFKWEKCQWIVRYIWVFSWHMLFWHWVSNVSLPTSMRCCFSIRTLDTSFCCRTDCSEALWTMVTCISSIIIFHAIITLLWNKIKLCKYNIQK